jgi:hypothetical protein
MEILESSFPHYKDKFTWIVLKPIIFTSIVYYLIEFLVRGLKLFKAENVHLGDDIGGQKCPCKSLEKEVGGFGKL